MGRQSAPAVGAWRGRRLGTAVDDPGRLATGQRPAAAGNAAGDAVVQLARRAVGPSAACSWRAKSKGCWPAKGYGPEQD